MAATSDSLICLNCSEETLPESVASCVECGKSCCNKCSREPDESVSLFAEPHILCLACYSERRQKDGIVTCPLHPERTLDLYCLTCNLQICYDCFVLLPEHKRHPIDTVEVIYRQKLLETVEKFRNIPQRLKLIDWEAIRQVDDNLKIVQDVEHTILQEVEQLIRSRTAVMLGKTAEKKRTLLDFKHYVLQMELRNRQMLKHIRNLNTSDFLRQQEVLNDRCDRILKDVDQLQVQSVPWDDIQCDLLPVCHLQPIVLNIPLDGDEGNKRVPFQLEDDCGIQWISICHIRAISLVLEMYPNQMVGDLNFQTVVEISHLNQMKMTRKTFKFREKLLPTELIPIEQLHECGFLSKAGDLRLKIGIRAENIVEENMLLKKLLVNQRKATGHLQMELAALKDQNFIQQGDMMRLSCEIKRMKELFESQTMALQRQIKELKLAAEERPSTPGSSVNVPLTPLTKVDKQKLTADMKRLQAKLDYMRITMKSMNPYAIGSFEIYRCSKDNKFYSPHLTSYNGVTIYVVVHPNFSVKSSPDVNAYICWAKGAKNKCQVFLEVLNEFEEANVRQDRVFDFSKGTSFTWKSIISHYVLNRDGGFLVDDHLKIKFGLRPMLE